jgi:hypothetical protein
LALILVSQTLETARLILEISKISRREDTSQDNHTGHANADHKQLQPDFKLKVVTASFADLPQH